MFAAADAVVATYADTTVLVIELAVDVGELIEQSLLGADDVGLLFLYHLDDGLCALVPSVITVVARIAVVVYVERNNLYRLGLKPGGEGSSNQ